MKLTDIPSVKLPADAELYRLSTVSNITLEPWFTPCLAAAFAKSKTRTEVKHIDYAGFGEAEPADTAAVKAADAVVVMLSFEELYPDEGDADEIFEDCSSRCAALYERIKAAASAPVIWLGFEDYASPCRHLFGHTALQDNLVPRLNEMLRAMLREGDTWLDLPRMIAEVGISTAYDMKSKYRWNAPYSGELISVVCGAIHKLWLTEHRISPKCLVLDCDNLLWQGTLADDGISGVSVGGLGSGRFYRDFQRFVLTLYRRGVILALCTKNDRDAVIDMLHSHSGMLLREEHFACIRANWDNKADNIRAISELLGIGLDSMVFVDDSPHEIGTVSEAIPEVRAILFRRETVFAELACFSLSPREDELQSALRNDTYRTNAMREELKLASPDNESYLRALDTRVDIHEAAEGELARIAELTRRTNRCTNGARFTAASLKAAMRDGMKLYAVTAADRFSDLGLVGAIGIKEDNLTLFSLSCRALGREIDARMLAFASEMGAVRYDFYDTGKNSVVLRTIDIQLGI